MSVLTISQINDIWTKRASVLDYIYVCDDGMLYKGISGGGLYRLQNTNLDSWNAQKKLNALTDANPTSTQSTTNTNIDNRTPTIVTTVNTDTGYVSVLSYDSNGNLIKKTLSLNGSVTETKNFTYNNSGDLTSLTKSDSSGVEQKDFNFNNNGDLTSIDIT